MSPEPVVAERVYDRLKRELLGDRFGPGTNLGSHALAQEFGTSISPVRDAMQRLVGERLLDLQTGGGFAVPRVTVNTLRHLYALHGQILHLALRCWLDEPPMRGSLVHQELPDEEDRIDLVVFTDTVFGAIAAGSNNPEHLALLNSLGDRLSAARRHEGAIRNRFLELRQLRDLVLSGEPASIVRAVGNYHRRRLKRCADIARSINSIERSEFAR